MWKENEALVAKSEITVKALTACEFGRSRELSSRATTVATTVNVPKKRERTLIVFLREVLASASLRFLSL